MSKDKRIKVIDKTVPTDPVEAAVQAAPPETPVDDTSVAPAPTVAEVMAKLTPQERALIEAQIKAQLKSKGAKANGMQGTFDAAFKKLEAELNTLHAMVVAYGFGDMPFQISLGTGLDGKPFVTGKRLRHREPNKPKADAPAAQPETPAASA